MDSEMKYRVKVKVVKDEDVIQHILYIEEKKSAGCGQGGKHHLRHLAVHDRSRSNDTLFLSTPAHLDRDDSCQWTDEAKPSVSLNSSEITTVCGNEMFSFRTPKKFCHTPLRNKDSGSVSSNGTVLKRSRQKHHVPIASPGEEDKDGECGGGQSVRARVTGTTTTPHRLRKRNMEELLTDGDSGSEGSGSSCSVDGEEDKAEETMEDSDVDFTKMRNLRTRQPAGHAMNFDLRLDAEEFLSGRRAHVVTSDHTLDRLDLPHMDVDTLRDALACSADRHTVERSLLYSQHQQLFRQWMLSLCNGYNVILYGVGSKRALLEDFRSRYLSTFSHIVVNGYFPSLTVKNILTSITEDILGREASFRTPDDHVTFVRDTFHKAECGDFYLLIHNIDGAALRSDTAQNALSLLAQINGVHIVASMDHINGPLIWDQTLCSRFRWIWHDASTYCRYTAETSYEDSLLVRRSGTLVRQSLDHVMNSLTSNARKIFMVLAQFHLDNIDQSSFLGMPFPDLYVRCRESFLVNNDQTLRSQLVEFRDHKMLQVKTNVDGVECLKIPIDVTVLKQFVDRYQSSLCLG